MSLWAGVLTLVAFVAFVAIVFGVSYRVSAVLARRERALVHDDSLVGVPDRIWEPFYVALLQPVSRLIAAHEFARSGEDVEALNSAVQAAACRLSLRPPHISEAADRLALAADALTATVRASRPDQDQPLIALREAKLVFLAAARVDLHAVSR